MKFSFENSKAVFLLYCLIIGIYFIQLPIQGSLPGKIDNWFYLATNEYLYNFIANGFSFDGIGTILYPSKSFLSQGNLSVGFSLVYIPLRAMNLPPVWIYWVICSLVFSLNAFGFYCLTKIFRLQVKWAFIGGLLFACSNYLQANIDNLDGLFWAFGLFSLSYLKRYFDQGDYRLIYKGALFLALQLYFSSYMFFLTGLIWAYYLLFELFENYKLNKKVLINTIVSFFIVVFLISPIFYFLFIKNDNSQSFNFLNITGANDTGLRLIDFIVYQANTFLGNKLLYAKDYWNEKTHAAGIGIITPIIGLYGLYRLKVGLKFWLLFLLILLLALGSFINLGQQRYFAPMFPLYEFLGLGSLIRIKIRLYIFIIFVIIVGWCYIMQKIEKELGFKKVVILLITVAIIENFPSQLRIYPSQKTINRLFETSNSYSLENRIVLNLPSSIYTQLYIPFFTNAKQLPDSDTEMAIEHQYMFLQTLNKSNSLNGDCAFIPNTRIKNQVLIFQMNNNEKLDSLISINHLERIVIHKYNIPLMNDGRELSYYKNALSMYPILFESDKILIYNVE
ncbi:MAG: hypothetical protein M9958_00720 [Chitinophagales bacterium]|nr:hypothetical protein [Chitinophagales bacterium]